MRMRVTINGNGHDRSRSREIAADLRRRFWESGMLTMDPDYPLRGTHRDEQGRAYFEFAVADPETAKHLLAESGYEGCAQLGATDAPLGAPCPNCENVAGPVMPTVCPNCGFRDISPCPVCEHEIPRSQYVPLGGDIFRCPHCRSHLRLRFNTPMFSAEGDFNPPLVIVAEAVAA